MECPVLKNLKKQTPSNLLLIKGHINKAKVSSFALVENISNSLCRETNKNEIKTE